MARTMNLRLTGMAASLELADQRAYLTEMQFRSHCETMRKTEEELMMLCASLEGWDSFCEWYDSSKVPSPSRFGLRIELLKNRIRRLSRHDAD